VTRTIAIPNSVVFELEHLVLDVNGTLTDRGELIDGVETKLRRLSELLDICLVSTDTFGSLRRVASVLGVEARVVGEGAEKAALVRELGSRHCVAIGNGANDRDLLREAALGIAVIGPEGAAGATIAVADVVCGSIGDALELLLDDQALAATLRP
jgi:soluble P-type ATPase